MVIQLAIGDLLLFNREEIERTTLLYSSLHYSNIYQNDILALIVKIKHKGYSNRYDDIFLKIYNPLAKRILNELPYIVNDVDYEGNYNSNYLIAFSNVLIRSIMIGNIKHYAYKKC